MTYQIKIKFQLRCQKRKKADIISKGVVDYLNSRAFPPDLYLNGQHVLCLIYTCHFQEVGSVHSWANRIQGLVIKNVIDVRKRNIEMKRQDSKGKKKTGIILPYKRQHS